MVRKASQYNYTVDSTYDEIIRIYYYKFEKQDKRKAKERIRDLFVLGCLTALRYSDYSIITAEKSTRKVHCQTNKENQCRCKSTSV